MRAFDKIKSFSGGIGVSMNILERDSFVVPIGHVYVTVESNEETVKLDLGPNFIVFEARLLMAQLMKFNFQAGDRIVNGVSHLAVGTGGPYQVGGRMKPFDLQNPPVPGVDIYNENKAGSYDTNGDGLSDLINEVCRKPVKTNYVDSQGNITNRRTSIVDFAATFEKEEANGPLVEMAIFGGDNAEQPKKGTMVAVKMFPVVNKSANSRITWTWRLAF